MDQDHHYQGWQDHRIRQRSDGNSSNYDRHIYMQNNGKLTFGVYPDAVKTVTSAQSYNDGQYHHVVAQLEVLN